MQLQVVTCVCENGGFAKRIAGLSHVLASVSGFLLDCYGIPLEQAVNHQDLPLFRFLTGTGEDALGKALDPKQVVACMQQAIATDQVDFLEVLMTDSSLGVFPDWLVAGDMSECAARHGRLSFLQSLWRHQPAWCSLKCLKKAARRGHLELVKFLVDKRLDQHAFAATLAAVSHGHRDVVEYLLEHCEIACVSCLMDQALRFGRFQLTAWLLEQRQQGAHVHRTCDCHQTKHKSQNLQAWMQESLCNVIDSPLDELKWLTDHFPQVDKQILHGKSLVVAATSGDVSKVSWLYGRLDHQTHKYAISAAVRASCTRGHLQVVRFFIENGHSQEIGWLDDAIRSGNLALVRLLQEAAGVTQVLHLDQAIDQAVCDGHLEVVQWFDSQRQAPYPLEALANAARTGNVPMLEFLLSKPHDSAVCVDTLLHGFRGGQLESVQLVYDELLKSAEFEALIERFWKILAEQSGLRNECKDECATLDHIEVLRFLLLHEASPNGDYCYHYCYYYAMRLVVRMRDLALLKQLGERFSDAFTFGVSMEDAVRSGSLAIVKFMHDKPQVQRRAEDMDVAAERGFLHIVEFLHQHGREGCTREALSWAAESGHWKVVRFLHQHRTEGNLHQALDAAIVFNQVQVIKYLWRLKDQSWDAKGALILACEQSSLQTVQWLLENTKRGHLDDEAYTIALSRVGTRFMGLDQRNQIRELVEGHRNQLTEGEL